MTYDELLEQGTREDLWRKYLLTEVRTGRPTNDLSSPTLHTTVTSQHLSRKLSTAKWMSLFTWLIMSTQNLKPKHQFTDFRVRKVAQHRTGLFLFLGARRFLEIQPWQPFIADMPYSYVFCLPLIPWTKTWPEQTYSITQNSVKEIHLPYTCSVRPAIRMFITHLVNKLFTVMILTLNNKM